MVNDKHLRKEEQARKDLITACKVCISLVHFYTAWVHVILFNALTTLFTFVIDYPVFHRICWAVKTPFTWWWFSLLLWPLLLRDTDSYGTALTWTLLLPVWKAFTSTQSQMYASDTCRNPLQSCLVFHSILVLLQKTSFEHTLTHPMTLFYHTWLKTVSKGTWTEEVVRNA